MELKDWLFPAIGFVFLALQIWIAYRKSGSEMRSEDSQASLNYQKLVLQLQSEMKIYKQELDELKNSTLIVTIEIPLGKAPTIKGFEWLRTKEEVEAT